LVTKFCPVSAIKNQCSLQFESIQLCTCYIIYTYYVIALNGYGTDLISFTVTYGYCYYYCREDVFYWIENTGKSSLLRLVRVT
jgi:hypothetical protein